MFSGAAPHFILLRELLNFKIYYLFFSQPVINADEPSLFQAMVRWGVKECERRGMDSNQPDRQRQCLGDALFLIRYLTFPPSDFAAGPAKSGLLTQTESFAILMNISSPGSWDMPEYMNKETEIRKIPRDLMPMLSSGSLYK